MVYQDLRLLTENRLANKLFACLTLKSRFSSFPPKKKQKSRLARPIMAASSQHQS
jgi:hypothetical protein